MRSRAVWKYIEVWFISLIFWDDRKIIKSLQDFSELNLSEWNSWNLFWCKGYISERHVLRVCCKMGTWEVNYEVFISIQPTIGGWIPLWQCLHSEISDHHDETIAGLSLKSSKPLWRDNRRLYLKKKLNSLLFLPLCPWETRSDLRLIFFNFHLFHR